MNDDCWPGVFKFFRHVQPLRGCIVLIVAAILGAALLCLAFSQGWIAIPSGWLSP